MSLEFDFSELKQKLSEIESEIAGEISQNALKLGAAPILDELKNLIPVETGELKAAAKITAVRKVKGANTVQIGFPKEVGRRNVEVGWYQNVGVRGEPGKFFMQECLENSREESMQIIIQELKKALEG